jgi:hypothetical protein
MRLVKSVERIDQKVGIAYLFSSRACFFMFTKNTAAAQALLATADRGCRFRVDLLSTCGEMAILRVGNSLIIAGATSWPERIYKDW